MAEKTEMIVVERSKAEDRLDAFLRSKFPAVSRGAFKRMIDEGDVTIAGKAVKPTHHPKPGEEIEIRWPEAKPAQTQPEEMPLAILFEDEDLLVLNKPPGLVIHPAAGHDSHTLVNALLHHCRGQLSGVGGVARPGIVHRLDKDTSGCLIVAKSDFAHLKLSLQFQQRTVEKVYHALLCGELSKAGGTIQAAIARHPTHRKRMAVSEEKGREAITSFKTLERLRHATLVEARLHTGRTHQIRVHFQHLGHPLVGDETYGARQNKRLEQLTGYHAARQMLHASRLAFVHPREGKISRFEAPWPEDFEEALRRLRV